MQHADGRVRRAGACTTGDKSNRGATSRSLSPPVHLPRLWQCSGRGALPGLCWWYPDDGQITSTHWAGDAAPVLATALRESSARDISCRLAERSAAVCLRALGWMRLDFLRKGVRVSFIAGGRYGRPGFWSGFPWPFPAFITSCLSTLIVVSEN